MILFPRNIYVYYNVDNFLSTSCILHLQSVCSLVLKKLTIIFRTLYIVEKNDTQRWKISHNKLQDFVWRKSFSVKKLECLAKPSASIFLPLFNLLFKVQNTQFKKHLFFCLIFFLFQIRPLIRGLSSSTVRLQTARPGGRRPSIHGLQLGGPRPRAKIASTLEPFTTWRSFTNPTDKIVAKYWLPRKRSQDRLSRNGFTWPRKPFVSWFDGKLDRGRGGRTLTKWWMLLEKKVEACMEKVLIEVGLEKSLLQK